MALGQALTLVKSRTLLKSVMISLATLRSSTVVGKGSVAGEGFRFILSSICLLPLQRWTEAG